VGLPGDARGPLPQAEPALRSGGRAQAADRRRQMQAGPGAPRRATACQLCSFSGRNENICFVLLR
jgi:hypothetical protein